MPNSRFLTHSPINFVFTKNSKDFSVEEIPLYKFSGDGEHTVVAIRKKDMTTWDMLSLFSSTIGVKKGDIGYAGLKDKDGMTIQYISIPKSFEARLTDISHPNIKILSTTRHKNKIKLGHLIGNRFFIRLKKINQTEFLKLKNGVAKIENEGMPNYFGYQRFGRDGKNYELGRAIVYGERKERNQNLKRFMISAYQSKLFNDWLSFRTELSHLIGAFDGGELKSAIDAAYKKLFITPPQNPKELKSQKQFFKLLSGDVMCHYPHGKLFFADELVEEGVRFFQKTVCPTGLLCGERNRLSLQDAYEVEKIFMDERIKALGDRRYAWIFPYDFSIEYDEENAHAKIRFTLPKGSYATVLLSELVGRELDGGEDFFEE